MLYTIISVALNVLGAIYAGIQFGLAVNPHRSEADAKSKLPFRFSSGLLVFAIPFFSPVRHDIGSSASFFIALAAITTLLIGRAKFSGPTSKD